MSHTRVSTWAAAALLAVALGGPARGADQTPPPLPPTVESPRPQVFVAIYERGSAWADGKSAFEQAGIQEHMAYLRANWATLIGAAPFEQGISAGAADRVVGMVLVLATNQQEAEALIAADPAISGNLMKATVRHWLADQVKAY